MALRIHAPANLGAQPARHQRRRGLDGQVVQVVLALVANFQHVPEPAGGQQAGGAAPAFNQRVGEQGGGVDHARDPLRVDVVGMHQPADAIGHALRRVAVGGKDLQADEPARPVVQRARHP